MANKHSKLLSVTMHCLRQIPQFSSQTAYRHCYRSSVRLYRHVRH